MASYAKRAAIKPQRKLPERAKEAVETAKKTASDVYGAVSSFVPGVALKRGLEKAKGALKKITRR